MKDLIHKSGNISAIYKRLKEAIATGEIIGIVYNGGSQPGAYREIIPLQLTEIQVRARCRNSGSVKIFNLDKIDVKLVPPNKSDGFKSWNAEPDNKILEMTVAEVEASYRVSLESIGWHVVLIICEEGEFLNLHGKSKAGKLLKHPTVALRYEAMTWDIMAVPNGPGVRTNLRPRARPWSVASRLGGKNGTWGIASKAIAVFLEEANKYP